jgi:hypothetical protein
MVDVKKFWIYVHTTKVKKGWDWVELPDGSRVSVPEGKYVKVMTIGNKTAIGFEDLTEEIGDKPDWDFSTPLCIVDEEVDGVQKVAKLRCRFTGRYHVSLFYEGLKVSEFWWGKTFDAPSFSYLDVQSLAQQLQIAPAPAVPAMPAFDYVIDIYANKIVVTDAYGNTVATLNTINDLNSWLSNVRGKKIRINANVEVYDTLYLTSNEYWIFGEWIHSTIYLIEKNISIYSFTSLGDSMMMNYVRNEPPPSYKYLDVSGLRLFAPYADLNIFAEEGSMQSGVVIVVGNTSQSFLGNIDGDIYIAGSMINIMDSRLRNSVILAQYLSLDNVYGENYEGTWLIISLGNTELKNTSTKNCGYSNAYLKFIRRVSVGANSTATLPLEIPDAWNGMVVVDGIYVPSGDTIYAFNPVPSGITYQIDLSQKAIVITNNTSNSYTIVVIYTWIEPSLI